MAPGGNQGTAAMQAPGAQEPFAAGKEQALEALRADWGSRYDIGTHTISEQSGPILLWVAYRVEDETPRYLIGFTAGQLAAVIADDDLRGTR